MSTLQVSSRTLAELRATVGAGKSIPEFYLAVLGRQRIEALVAIAKAGQNLVFLDQVSAFIEAKKPKAKRIALSVPKLIKKTAVTAAVERAIPKPAKLSKKKLKKRPVKEKAMIDRSLLRAFGKTDFYEAPKADSGGCRVEQRPWV